MKKIKRCHQLDGSVLNIVSFSCPAPSCNQEFAGLWPLVDHIEEVHGVCLDPFGHGKRKDMGNGGFTLRSVYLPSGEERLICPACIMQFHPSEKKELFDHMAREHGESCASPEDVSSRHSEDLDLLWQAPSVTWFPQRDEALRRLRIVSLGSFCGMKVSLQRLGLGEAHLPFDWIRSRSAGLQLFLRNDFAGFFSVASQCDVPGTNLKMFRSMVHSFWHDDIKDPEIRKKLQRRIDRFRALRDDPSDLLFVRSCASTDELREVEGLHDALQQRFGTSSRRVLLAVVVDGQRDLEGPILHAQTPSIAFFPHPPWKATDVAALCTTDFTRVLETSCVSKAPARSSSTSTSARASASSEHAQWLDCQLAGARTSCDVRCSNSCPVQVNKGRKGPLSSLGQGLWSSVGKGPWNAAKCTDRSLAW
eukprot:CAMPEP_0179171576 /NCGR_PEP_ID=MMETSP0796-20121207/84583_1 /TAXON_ID=73915 /ORGANISM="Pyrodinium bahamense, Strain pbaha01" /LENGTH=419 /DNA_ID=CAMNT_0020874655 /DNA_START=73 /DNA_END=1330 /DNA_ORIENTATION=+